MITIKGDTEEVDGGHRYAPNEDEIPNTDVSYVFIGNEHIRSDRLMIRFYINENEFGREI